MKKAMMAIVCLGFMTGSTAAWADEESDAKQPTAQDLKDKGKKMDASQMEALKSKGTSKEVGPSTADTKPKRKKGTGKYDPNRLKRLISEGRKMTPAQMEAMKARIEAAKANGKAKEVKPEDNAKSTP